MITEIVLPLCESSSIDTYSEGNPSDLKYADNVVLLSGDSSRLLNFPHSFERQCR